MSRNPFKPWTTEQLLAALADPSTPPEGRWVVQQKLDADLFAMVHSWHPLRRLVWRVRNPRLSNQYRNWKAWKRIR